MLPIKDTIRSRSFPIVTWLLIIANGLIFFYELSLSPAGLQRFVLTFGLVPARVDLQNPLTWMPFFTHMFLHSGWFHFISNIWIFHIFGDNVEDRMGSGRFLLFYLLGGIAAGALQTAADPASTLPAIGASGAIAATLGAYFISFPRARVITLVPLFLVPWIVEIPAIVFLGFWFVSQLFSGFLSLATPSQAAVGGVAWWAHIGGFVFGLLVALPFSIRKPKRREFMDEYYPW
ncbi:MAG: rhomboid family intramembrane serine protease [Anaerolineaceae bacterium]|nr:rhomboid family intramembrane serine protease [Anaerolineaceae bacterium]